MTLSNSVDPKFWEEVLEREGLGVRQLGLQDEDPSESLPLPIDTRPARKKSTNNPDFEKLRTILDTNDSFVAGGHEIKKIRTRKKDVPAWALNNKKVQELLLRVFPKLRTDPKQRRRAARWAAAIHLFYRVGMTHSQIAAELKTKSVRIKLVLQHIRWSVRGFTANHRGLRKAKKGK